MYRESTTNMGALKRITDEYFGDTTSEEDLMVLNPAKRERITIFDDDKLLSEYHTNLLHDGASMFFKLGVFSSLYDVLKSMGVKVRICKGIPLFCSYFDDKFINEAIEYWRKRLANDNRLCKIIEELERERQWMKVTTIRGRYLRKEKIIELFPEEMLSESNGKKYFSYLLLSSFVHEAMHAYFDRPGHNHHPYAYFVEEPMAEFGMLLYLDEAVHNDALQKWAYDDTLSIKGCYSFGATLYDQYCAWNYSLRDHLEAYKYGISEYQMLNVDATGKHVALPLPDDLVDRGRATVTTSSSTSSSTYFDFDKDLGVNPRVWTSIPADIVRSKSLGVGTTINISFYDQMGVLLFDDTINISTLNRITLSTGIQEKFMYRYGLDKVHFGFREISPGQWEAHEL